MDNKGLIIHLEDEFALQSAFKLAAKKHGYDLLQYSDATEANLDNKYKDAKVIVSDFNMNGGDAPYMLSFLKQNSIKTPVIMLTGIASNLDIIKEKNLMDNVIAFKEKPVSTNEIFEIIEKYKK